MRPSVILAAGLLAAIPLGLCAADDLFDVRALSSTPLHPRTLKKTEHSGLVTEEVRFHSETDGKTDVDIFAYFSYPKGARRKPAYIWNPGGLGQASRSYTEGGAARGYAVLCIDFPQPGYRSTGNYPINTGLTVGRDPRQAPIYRGVVALLKAVSYLETRPEVDPDRIGMAGSSWGGFFTTLMVGIDPRLKVGSCAYGTGSLQLGNAWWDGVSRNGRGPAGPAERERWRTTLDPAWRLPTKKTPIGWLTGTNDAFYSMPALMKSYAMAGGEKHLTLVPNWDHALPVKLHDDNWQGWLDAHLMGKQAFPTVGVVAVTNENGQLVAKWDFQGGPTAADLIVSYGESGNWRGRYWHTFPAKIEGRSCRAELPSATLPCFVSGSVVDALDHRSSTALLRVDSAALGIRAASPLPDYDGCALWGGFEPEQIQYLKLHNMFGQKRWLPRLSTDAVGGKHSAILESGRTDLPPILSTTGIPSRFACFMKADRPLEVVVDLSDKRRSCAVGTSWKEFQVELTPPAALMGVFPAGITIPPGCRVLVDSISFHPVLSAGGR